MKRLQKCVGLLLVFLVACTAAPKPVATVGGIDLYDIDLKPFMEKSENEVAALAALVEITCIKQAAVQLYGAQYPPEPILEQQKKELADIKAVGGDLYEKIKQSMKERGWSEAEYVKAMTDTIILAQSMVALEADINAEAMAKYGEDKWEKENYRKEYFEKIVSSAKVSLP